MLFRSLSLTLFLTMSLISVSGSVFAEEATKDDGFEITTEEVAEEVTMTNVPKDGSVDDYKKFLETNEEELKECIELLKMNAQVNNTNQADFLKEFQASVKKFTEKRMEAVEAALKIKDISDDDFVFFVGKKAELIALIAQLNKDNSAKEKLTAYADELRKAGKNKAADIVEVQLFQVRLITCVMGKDVDAFAELVEETIAKMEKAGKDIKRPLAEQALMVMIMSQKIDGYTAPDGLAEKIIKTLAQATDPEVKKLIEPLVKQIEAAKEKALKQLKEKQEKADDKKADDKKADDKKDK